MTMSKAAKTLLLEDCLDHYARNGDDYGISLAHRLAERVYGNLPFYHRFYQEQIERVEWPDGLGLEQPMFFDSVEEHVRYEVHRTKVLIWCKERFVDRYEDHLIDWERHIFNAALNRCF